MKTLRDMLRGRLVSNLSRNSTGKALYQPHNIAYRSRLSSFCFGRCVGIKLISIQASLLCLLDKLMFCVFSVDRILRVSGCFNCALLPELGLASRAHSWHVLRVSGEEKYRNIN